MPTNILYIEDDETDQEALKRVLAKSPVSVDCAPSVLPALDMLKAKEYHLVLLDFKMPGLNGLEAIPLIRGQTKAPILMVSGSADPTQAVLCLKAGAVDYVRKEHIGAFLVDAVERAMKRDQAKDFLASALEVLKEVKERVEAKLGE